MKTIKQIEVGKTTLKVILRSGYACPRCKNETWANRENCEELEKGWCTHCAYSGEPLKIIKE